MELQVSMPGFSTENVKELTRTQMWVGCVLPRHSQSGNSMTDVVFEHLCAPSRGEADREVPVIDSHCSESICTGWFGSHSNLQSVMQIALGL